MDGQLRKFFRSIMNNPYAKPSDNYPLYQFILRLKHREGWSNITCDYSYTSKTSIRTGQWDKLPPGIGNNKYSEEQIRTVCKHLESGKSTTEILELLTGSPYQKNNRQIYDFIDGIRRKKKTLDRNFL